MRNNNPIFNNGDMNMTEIAAVNQDFTQMLAGAQLNRPYKRDSWSTDRGYVLIPLGSNQLHTVQLSGGDAHLQSPNFSIEDYQATDWREATSTDFPTPT
jgi:hypothetical protein